MKERKAIADHLVVIFKWVKEDRIGIWLLLYYADEVKHFLRLLRFSKISRPTIMTTQPKT